LFILLVRGFAGITSHALYSAIFCAGVMWILGRTPGERNVPRGLICCLLAMFLHFAWDDAGALAGGSVLFSFLLPYLILMPLSIIVLFWVLRHAASTERVWVRDLLAPEAEAGVLDPALLTAVSGLRRDRKRFRKQVRSRRRARHLMEAANDLAHEIASAGGAETARVAHARSELLRIEGVRPPQPAR